jgi:hypothetical protein
MSGMPMDGWGAAEKAQIQDFSIFESDKVILEVT